MQHRGRLDEHSRRSTEDVGSLKLRSDAHTAQRLEEPGLHFRHRARSPSDIAKSPLAARVAPIPAERALAGFRRALGPPLRFESPGTTAVALAPPRPADE